METSLDQARGAFASQLERQRPGLVAFLRRRAPGGTAVEDAVQETMLRAWQERARYDPERPLGPWLLTLAAHVAEDLRRRERRRAAEPLEAEPADRGAPAPTDHLDRRETLGRLGEALAELPRAAREVFLAFHRDGQELSVIATRSGLPLGTVKSHLHRARRRLARHLDGARG